MDLLWRNSEQPNGYLRHIHGGVYTITATSWADVTRSAAANIAVTDLASVASWRNHNSRSGVNSWEYALSPTSTAVEVMS